MRRTWLARNPDTDRRDNNPRDRKHTQHTKRRPRLHLPELPQNLGCGHNQVADWIEFTALGAATWVTGQTAQVVAAVKAKEITIILFCS
ncbi:MAG: hypothetical protein O7D94_12735 [Planctomycetota bacterium]|nr:hypothetical protein [Planctomycetota bacterium]